MQKMAGKLFSCFDIKTFLKSRACKVFIFVFRLIKWTGCRVSTKIFWQTGGSTIYLDRQESARLQLSELRGGGRTST